MSRVVPIVVIQGWTTETHYCEECSELFTDRYRFRVDGATGMRVVLRPLMCVCRNCAMMMQTQHALDSKLRIE